MKAYTCTPPQIRITEEAANYCRKMAMNMVATHTQDESFDGGFGHRVTMTFACTAP